jgi:hypothetical protein
MTTRNQTKHYEKLKEKNHVQWMKNVDNIKNDLNEIETQLKCFRNSCSENLIPQFEKTNQSQVIDQKKLHLLFKNIKNNLTILNEIKISTKDMTV